MSHRCEKPQAHDLLAGSADAILAAAAAADAMCAHLAGSAALLHGFLD
jgi:hypothetical protein